MDLVSSLRRRWILASVLLLLTIGGSAFAWFTLSPTYQAQSSVVFLATPNAVKIAGGNPYLAFTTGLNLTADVVRYETMDMRTAESLAAQGATSTYLVAGATDTSGPVLNVTVTGHNKANVERTLQAVTKEITTRLDAIQVGLNADNKIKDSVITFSPVPTLQKSKKVKPLLVAFAFGLVLTIAIPVMVDGQRTQRKQKDDGASADGAAYPLGRVASDWRKSASEQSPLVMSGRATSLDDSRRRRPGRARSGSRLSALFQGSGDDGGPAGGPGGRGSTGPGCSFLWSLGRLGAGQGACGKALIRFQAATMSAA